MTNSTELILNAQRNLTTSRQILALNIEKDNIDAANELYEEQRLTRSRKRSLSQPITPTSSSTAKKHKVAIDTITIAGLKGTLGENLARLGDQIEPICAESRYFGYLSKNGIIDISDSTPASQLALLGRSTHIKNFLHKKYAYSLPVLESSTNMTNELNVIVKKARSVNIEDIYNTIDTKIARNTEERAIKDIYRHIIQQHAFKSHMLTDEYVLKCSEMSTITKYWSPILESYFGERRGVFIQWGDTLSIDCKNVNLNYKLDLRMIANTEGGYVEVVTGEFANTKATIESKLYGDKLKSVLSSKCHLNALLEKLKYLPQSEVTQVCIPILQVMGQNLSMYVLSLVDKQIYIVQNVIDTQYPRTLKDLRDGGIGKLIHVMRHIDYMLDKIEENIETYSRDTSNKMKKITGRGGANNQKFKVEIWTTAVEWEPHVSDSDTDQK